MAIKKQHAKEKTICNTCYHPVNTRGHEDMTIPVKLYVKGKARMIRQPCPNCVKMGRRDP